MAQTITFPVQNMTCGGCAARVTQLLKKVPGAEDVSVNLADETAQITVEQNKPVIDAISALGHAGYPARTEEMRLAVSGMSCASCVGRLDRALRAEAGVVDVNVNLADESATLRFVPGATTAARLAEVATKTGYPARIASQEDIRDHGEIKQAEAEGHRQAMILAAALTIPVFVLEMGGHLFPAWHHFIARTIGLETSWVIQFLLTTAVLVGPGRHFFTKGIPALWRRAPNMDSLVALGAGSAWTFSTVALFAPSLLPQGTRVVYFEAAAVIVTLILLGRWFEARAKGQTGAAIRQLIGLQPRTAMVRQGAEWVEVPVAELSVG
ncbi:MAG: heavy metal translocating P-type ATPase, partial [Sulfitobacter sp.]|nr:heavy metal translocating P-type ATPase [Sulfitobacter sp.]